MAISLLFLRGVCGASRDTSVGVVVWGASRDTPVGVVVWVASRDTPVGVVVWGASRDTPVGVFFLSFRLIPKKLMSSYNGMEECEKTNTTTKRKI